MDHEAFEERAAIKEYEGGLSRFRAETEAAAEQGATRWEALGHVAGRVVEKSRHQRETVAQRNGKDNLPEVQPASKEENRPVLERKRNG